MSEHDHDPFIEGIAAELRRPVRFDSGFDARVMAALEPAVIPMRRTERSRPWILRPRTISLTPLAGLAAAAALAGVVALGVWRAGSVAAPSSQVAQAEPAREPMVLQPVANAPAPAPAPALLAVPFILTFPNAEKVSIVGDFNDWDASRNQLELVSEHGVWSTRVMLPAGRHRYSFVVNDTMYVNDPAASQSEDDGFGTANNVIIVKESGQ